MAYEKLESGDEKDTREEKPAQPQQKDSDSVWPLIFALIVFCSAMYYCITQMEELERLMSEEVALLKQIKTNCEIHCLEPIQRSSDVYDLSQM